MERSTRQIGADSFLCLQDILQLRDGHDRDSLLVNLATFAVTRSMLCQYGNFLLFFIDPYSIMEENTPQVKGQTHDHSISQSKRRGNPPKRPALLRRTKPAY